MSETLSVTQNSAPSHHDLFITTSKIARVSIFNLPHGYEVTCNRVGGWTLWRLRDFNPPSVHGWAVAGVGGDGWEKVAGEYDKGLRLDVAGHVIVDSLTPRESS